MPKLKKYKRKITNHFTHAYWCKDFKQNTSIAYSYCGLIYNSENK